jgi:hypothetical protein
MATVFDNIVTKENDHTHLLRSLMERHPGVAAAVLSHLLKRPVTDDLASKFSFKAQSFFQSDLGREIPDLVITGPHIHCLIEAKIDPSLELTEAQRQGYRRCFPQSEEVENSLCFLVPNEWKHSELIHQVRGTLPASITCRVSYWRQLITKLEKAATSIEDAILNEAILFWKWRFEVESMTSKERLVLTAWSGSMYSAVSKLEKTVKQAQALFEARGWTTELETGSQSFGFYLKHGGSYLLWVGIWTEAHAPLCLGVDARKSGWIRPRNFDLAPAKTKDLTWHLWPLDPMTWDDAENIYDRVTNFTTAQYDAGVGPLTATRQPTSVILSQ